jgi:hypothetical protein
MARAGSNDVKRVYEGIVRLPDPPLTYADEMRRRGKWRLRPRPEHARPLFYVVLSMAALAFVYGLLAVTP